MPYPAQPFRRVALGSALIALAFVVPAAVAACTSGDSSTPFAPDVDAGPEAAPPNFGDSAYPVSTFDQASPSFDAGPPPACPGSALPTTATNTCAIDTSQSCPSCAPWGFVCPTFAAPELPDGQAPSVAASCSATALDSGAALVCCAQPVCVVSIGSGCDASTATRYECTGSVVPPGACTWLGAGAPNDYCCE